MCFDLTGLKLTPSSGILRLEAPQGMTLSDAPQSSPKTVIELPYSNGRLWNQCFYLHFSPKHAEKVSTVIPIIYGNNKRFLPVTAISKKISHQSPVIRECPDIAVKSLIQTEKGITIETGKWPADIDEDGKRYAEVIIQSNEKSLIIRRISFTLEPACRSSWEKSRDLPYHLPAEGFWKSKWGAGSSYFPWHCLWAVWLLNPEASVVCAAPSFCSSTSGGSDKNRLASRYQALSWLLRRNPVRIKLYDQKQRGKIRYRF